MSIRSDPLDELAIPDGTTVEEHDLVAAGDVVVGGQSAVEFGVRGHNVIAGERVRFGGDIEAGFEANGWIVIRNPMPTIVFLFVYLSQLLRIGEEEAARDVVSELLEGEREYEPVVIPRGARVSDDAWRVSTPARIGEDCRLHGNVRATSIDVGRDTEVFGSLRARGDVSVAPGAVIHGDVTTRGGSVRVAAGAHVRGDVSCEDLDLHDDAEVDGAIRARGEVSIDRATPGPVIQDAEDDEAAATDETVDDDPADGEGDEPAGEEDETEPTPAIVRVEDSLGESLEELESAGNGDGGLIVEAEEN